MSEALRCGFCGHETDGLTLYSVAGVFRLLVCETCYQRLVAKEHQPHSTPMKRLHRLLGLNVRREVVDDEGPAGCDGAPGDSLSAVAQGEAQLRSVSVAEPAVSRVSRNAQLGRHSR